MYNHLARAEYIIILHKDQQHPRIPRENNVLQKNPQLFWFLYSKTRVRNIFLYTHGVTQDMMGMWYVAFHSSNKMDKNHHTFI